MTKKGLTKYLSIGAVTTAALFLAACSNQKSTTSAKIVRQKLLCGTQ